MNENIQKSSNYLARFRFVRRNNHSKKFQRKWWSSYLVSPQTWDGSLVAKTTHQVETPGPLFDTSSLRSENSIRRHFPCPDAREAFYITAPCLESGQVDINSLIIADR